MSRERKINTYVGNINCVAVIMIWKIFNFDLSQTFSLMLECILQTRLADPDIVSDPSEYQKLAQCISELGACLQHKRSRRARPRGFGGSEYMPAAQIDTQTTF